ncbi:MAG: hypothetical protein AAFS02_16790, partial [Pseudomonadota bacterium]
MNAFVDDDGEPIYSADTVLRIPTSAHPGPFETSWSALSYPPPPPSSSSSSNNDKQDETTTTSGTMTATNTMMEGKFVPIRRNRDIPKRVAYGGRFGVVRDWRFGYNDDGDEAEDADDDDDDGCETATMAANESHDDAVGSDGNDGGNVASSSSSCN